MNSQDVFVCHYNQDIHIPTSTDCLFVCLFVFFPLISMNSRGFICLFIKKVVIASLISAPWACTQVNHNCQMLSKFLTGTNSAMHILPRSNSAVQGVPAQRVSTDCCARWMRRWGLSKPGSEGEQHRSASLMHVAAVPSCASERWWAEADWKGFQSSAPGCQRRRETAVRIPFLSWLCFSHRSVGMRSCFVRFLWCDMIWYKDNPRAFTA